MNTHFRHGLLLISILFLAFLVVIIVQADTGRMSPLISQLYAFPYGDKIGHLLLMGCLSFLVNLALTGKTIRIFTKPVLLGSLLVGLAVTLEEFSQLLTHTRNFSLVDLGFDYLGIICSGWAVQWWLPDRQAHALKAE